MTPNKNMGSFPQAPPSVHHLNPAYLHNPATTQQAYVCDANGQVYP
jgi:hypothetical protein